MKLKSKISLNLIILTWFSVSYPVVENLRSNLDILFISEINQIIIFILLLGIFALIFILLNKYFFKFSETQFIVFIFTIFFLFWNYKNISTEAYYYFNERNLSGFLTYLFLFILFMYLISKKSIYKYLYRLITVLFVIQIIFMSYTILNVKTSLFFPNNDEGFKQSDELLKNRPDIYFLTYDAVGSNEYNINNFNVDFNKLAIQYESFNLEIFDNQYSNYARTIFQLSGIMEMEPIQKNNDSLDDSEVNSVINKVNVNNTTVENYFLENGYTLYKYGLFFKCVDENNVYCIEKGAYDVNTVNTVVSDIVDQTPLRLLKENKIIKLTSSTSKITKYLFFNTCGLINQECEDQDISKILNYEQVEGPKLYLLHFMFSHGPFYLDSLCRPYPSEIEMVNFHNIGYNDALNCMYLEVNRLLDSIPSDSVIIIQSDHGPLEKKRDRFNLNQMNNEDINAQYSIFSMSNINKFCKDKVSSFGGMNTFSILINCLTNNITFETREDYYYYLFENDDVLFFNINETINSLKN